METCEVFCGTKSFSKVAEKLGHSVFTIDNNIDHNPNLHIDYLNFGDHSYYDVMWFSPPCTAFSVASMGKHWIKETKEPKSQTAITGLQLLDKTIMQISIQKPKIWFIENPVGFMRKKIDELFKKWGIIDYERKTVWYCQYGDSRAKPTDIWTNLKDWNPRICKNNNPDCNHQRAPRGSKTGTQGLKNNIERGRIPEALLYEIFKVIENGK